MNIRLLTNLGLVCLTLALPFAANGQQEGQEASPRERLAAGLELLNSSDWEQAGSRTISAVIKEARDAGDLRVVAEAVARLIEVGATTEAQETRSAAFGLIRRAGPESNGGFLVSPDQLLELFEMSSSFSARSASIAYLGQHPSRARAVEMLGLIALRPDDPENSWARVAIETLFYDEDLGVAKLRELHSSGDLKSESARRELDYIARTGFKWRDGS